MYLRLIYLRIAYAVKDLENTIKKQLTQRQQKTTY